MFTTEKGKLVPELGIKAALGFGIAMWYRPPPKWPNCQTSKSTETYFEYVWACQSVLNKLKPFRKSLRNVMCYLSSSDLLLKDYR
jgi:hypothetical protein